jgi:hypothetical protein
MSQQLQEKLGMRPEELMSRLVGSPELMRKFDDPQVGQSQSHTQNLFLPSI